METVTETVKADPCQFGKTFPNTGPCAGPTRDYMVGEGVISEVETFTTFWRGCEHHERIAKVVEKFVRALRPGPTFTDEELASLALADKEPKYRPATSKEFADRRLPLRCPDCGRTVARMPIVDLHSWVVCTDLDGCHFREASSLAASLFDDGKTYLVLVEERLAKFLADHPEVTFAPESE